VLAWDRLGLAAVAIGMSLGSAVGVCLMAIAAARMRALPPLTLVAPRREIFGFLRHAGPLTAGSAVLQFNLVADRAIASLLSVGAVSVLKFGQQLVTEPLGSLSSAWTTSLYPSLVRSGVAGSERSLGVLSALALRYTIAIFVPISFGVAALAPLLVDVVYRRGAFDARAAAETAFVVAAFSPMLALAMINPILTGAHNARRNGVLLAITAISNATCNLILNVTFGRLFGVAGVALSTSVTLAAMTVFLAWRLARVEADFDRESILRVGGRVLLASMIPAAVVGAVSWLVLGGSLSAPANLVALAGLATAGAIGYLGIATFLGIREPTELLGRAGGSIRSWARR
jgi:putative peptidoglycan lipid II flippase